MWNVLRDNRFQTLEFGKNLKEDPSHQYLGIFGIYSPLIEAQGKMTMGEIQNVVLGVLIGQITEVQSVFS